MYVLKAKYEHEKFGKIIKFINTVNEGEKYIRQSKISKEIGIFEKIKMFFNKNKSKDCLYSYYVYNYKPVFKEDSLLAGATAAWVVDCYSSRKS